MSSSNNPGDARGTRNIVVEARVAPTYALQHLDARELMKFEADYNRYASDASEEAGTTRSKTSCFNEKILKYIARFKSEEVITWTEVTDEMLQMVIDDTLVEAGNRRGDTREVETIAKDHLSWDKRLNSCDHKVDKLFVTWCDFLESYRLEEYFKKKGNAKKVGKILISAVQPEALRIMIERRIDIEGTDTLKDDKVMMTIIREEARNYEAVTRAESESKNTSGNNNGGNNGSRSGGNNARAEAKPGRTNGRPMRAEHRAESKSNGGQVTRTPNSGPNEVRCLGCNAIGHRVASCPSTNAERRQMLLLNFREQRREERMRLRSGREVGSRNASGTGGRANNVRVNIEEHEVPEDDYLILGDTDFMIDYVCDDGADHTYIARETADRFLREYPEMQLHTLEEPFRVELAVDGYQVLCANYFMLKYVLHIAMGFIHVPVDKIFVLDAPMRYMLVGRPALKSLGIDVEAQLNSLALQEDAPPVRKRTSAYFVKQKDLGTGYTIEYNAADVNLTKEDLEFELYDEDILGLVTDQEHQKGLEDLIARAMEAGLPVEHEGAIRDLVYEYSDVFRVKLGQDPPAKVNPWIVYKKEKAVPVRCATRIYTPKKREFLKKFMDELVEANMMKKNDHSRWASAAHPVSKPGSPGEFRFTADFKAINKKLEVTAYPAPVLEALIQLIGVAMIFATLDLFKGFWQFPLDESCQEYFSVQTPDGVFTPNRVMQGSTTGTGACQAGLEQILGELLRNGVLAYVDDMFIYSPSINAHLEMLRKVLEKCRLYGLKLSMKKCNLFCLEAKWCGRIFSAAGISNDPDRISALRTYPIPSRADQLQSFLAAINWMRTFLPKYADVTRPLYVLLEKIMKGMTSRKSSDLKKIDLSKVWNEEAAAAWENVRNLLIQAVTLAVIDPQKVQCVYTDASQQCWSVVVTQIEESELFLTLSEQHHQPLIFLSGTFKGASERWPIVDKEAFAIMMAVKRCDYFLANGKPFHLYTDHRNLVNIFSPEAAGSDMPKYRADRLARWGMILRNVDFVLHHIAGDDNLVADLFSRFLNPHYVEKTASAPFDNFTARLITRSGKRVGGNTLSDEESKEEEIAGKVRVLTQ